MGLYIAGPARDKAKYLIDNHDAVAIPQPKEWLPNLVCIIHNELFEGARYCYNQAEFDASKATRTDHRYRSWLLVPRASQLAK